ncbi:MAG: hypothetical protein M0033_07970 [Nitrospiraceae bacterium]|nr:hypothetical protein [Nitrospiraceae bacterium]
MLLFSPQGAYGPLIYPLAALAAAWIIGSGAAVLGGKGMWHVFAWRSINACVLASAARGRQRLFRLNGPDCRFRQNR